MYTQARLGSNLEVAVATSTEAVYELQAHGNAEKRPIGVEVKVIIGSGFSCFGLAFMMAAYVYGVSVSEKRILNIGLVTKGRILVKHGGSV